MLPRRDASAPVSSQPSGARPPATQATVATLEADVRTASLTLATLERQRESASQAVAALPAEIANLRKYVPLWTEQLAKAAAAVKAADHNLAEFSRDFDRFRRTAPTPDQIERADRYSRGERLSTLEEAAWRENPEAKRAAVRYTQGRDELLSIQRTLAAGRDRASEAHNTLVTKLAAAHTRLASASRTLADSQNNLAASGQHIAATKREIDLKTAERERVRQQLVAEEARRQAQIAATQRAAEARALRETERSRAAPVSASVAAVPALMPRTNSSGRPLIIFLSDEDDDLQGEPVDLASVIDSPPAVGTFAHRDGRGLTHVRGNQTLVERVDGSAALYTREGQWESVQTNSGVQGVRFYDDFRGVTQYDSVNPNSGLRSYGEQPYPGNDFGQGWWRRDPLW